MNKVLKIIILVQVLVIFFLSGLVLGMRIQKNRSEEYLKKILSSNKEDTSAEHAKDSMDANDENPSNMQDNSDTSNTNAVTVERDVDYSAMDVPEPTTDDWLFTDGNRIVDADGNEVWLTGINWFGYNTGTNTFDGLWASDLNQSIQEIANHGFNVIRVPFSAELVLQWSRGEYPVDLGKYQNKLVYSPHDYGPTVYQQPWFEGDYTYDSLMKDCWHDNWLYIHEDKLAPLLIGEWGGFMSEPNITWMTYMRQLISTYKLHHTFWCFNANSGDTGGMVLDDFTTWDEDKYNFVKEVLWNDGDKFIGLDHEIPLGINGIRLGDYYK